MDTGFKFLGSEGMQVQGRCMGRGEQEVLYGGRWYPVDADASDT